MLVEKLTTGAGLIVTAIVVSSEHVAEDVVSTTLKVEADKYVCVGFVLVDNADASPKFQE